jgi:hypothetical protein
MLCIKATVKADMNIYKKQAAPPAHFIEPAYFIRPSTLESYYPPGQTSSTDCFDEVRAKALFIDTRLTAVVTGTDGC